ncbi:hypothetical protein [Streptomyces violascens]|uniref:Uncharacterized protein n=1 Tax=Streptomyces violascens TaxID=67381 RepID=A0ABQ3QRH1_9ACTN|nr:hypothetical protein [Streptomyces violascens]GGU48768.1 hypothetical protein GCM10010289_81600 [Streptomyces violascens]GHI39849.1 hypothetical protein Sviol_42570 [Streptomyces violascens]
MLLRGAARLDAGLELTDLERRLVDCVAPVLEPDEILDFGRVFAQESEAGHTRQVLPEVLTARGITEGYSEADLSKDLAALGDEVRAEANLNVVDVDGARQPDGSWDSAEFVEAMADYGFAVTLMVSSRQEPALASQLPRVNARLDFARFYCVRDTPESTKDEIYWAYGAANDAGTKRKNVTREYGSGVKGKWWTFDSGTTLFDGQVGTSLPVHIECWEADDSPNSWYNKLREALDTVNEKLAEIALHFRDNPAWHWDGSAGDIQTHLYFLTAFVAALIEWFRNDDDLVQARTIVFSRPALANLAARPEGTDFWNFNSSEGHFQLYIKLSTPNEQRLRHTASSNGTSWNESTMMAAANSLTGPALAEYSGKLYCVHRGSTSNENLYWTRFDGTSWNTDIGLGGHMSAHSPALAVYGNKLYCVHRGSGGNQELWVTSFDGTRWSSDTRLGGHMSAHGPALAVYGNKLYCVHRGAADTDLWVTFFDGTRWSSDTRISGQKSTHAPALAVYNGKLHCVYRGLNTENLWWCTFDGTRWSGSTQIGTSLSAAAPALAVFNNKLYCVHRGSTSNSNPKLYAIAFNGTSWGQDNVFGTTTGTTTDAPAAAGYQNKLHVVHRGGGLL